MSDELTITKRDAELIADIVVLKLKRVMQEQISAVIDDELSPLLTEIVQSLSTSFISLKEIKNTLASTRRSPKEDLSESERPLRKKSMKRVIETGDTLGDQYVNAPNRHRRSEDLQENTRPRREQSWDEDDDDVNEVESMLAINNKLLEEEEADKRRRESQLRFDRLSRDPRQNEEQPKNTHHDSKAESKFVESFLNENAPDFNPRSRSRSRSSMGSVAPEREEDLMDEIIDEDVRRTMNGLGSPSAMDFDDSPREYDPTASYDEFDIPADVNVSGANMPSSLNDFSQSGGNRQTSGDQVGMRDGGGWEPIPPPQVI